MKAHKDYREVDIPGLYKIPKTWIDGKFKYNVYYQEGPGLRHWQFMDKGVKVICVTNITENGIDFSSYTKYISKEEYESSYKHFTVKRGNLLIASSGASWGKIAEYDSNEIVILNTSTIRLETSKRILNSFLKYLLESQYIQDQLSILITGSCQPNFGPTHLSKLDICLPSDVEEQRQIAAYLDYKTQQIDRFIANRKKQIELLEEQKEAIINKAITVGIDNVDLEVIETHWYSLKPKNWELLKFNAAINLIHGFQFRDNDFTAEGIKIVKITQLNANGTLDLTIADTIDEKRLSSFKSRIIKNGDILMALTGGTIGKIIRVEDLDEIVLQNYRVGKFEPRYKNQLSKRYLFWVLRSEKTFAQINFLLRETGQPNIGKGDFSKMFFALPPTIEEQDSIADFIEKELAERNELISKYQNQIDLMQEYKTSLISKAVTGKIDVREWEPKQTLKETV